MQNESLSGQLFCWFFYASIVTLLTAIRSDTFVHDLEAFIEGLGNAVTRYFSMIMDAGESAAGICTHIRNPIVHDILYLIVASLVGISLIAITAFIAYFLIKEYVSRYKQRICDHISLWVAVITLAFTIFFAEDIKDIISVNLIGMNMIIHLIYTGIRAYMISDDQ